MDVHTRKAMTHITQCFLLFLILRLVEELLIVPRFNSQGLIACVGGFVILLIYIRFINKPMEAIGVIVDEHKARKGIILAAIFDRFGLGVYLRPLRVCLHSGYDPCAAHSFRHDGAAGSKLLSAYYRPSSHFAADGFYLLSLQEVENQGANHAHYAPYCSEIS